MNSQLTFMRLHTASHRPLFLVMDLSMNQNKCVRIIVLKEDKWQNWPSFSVLPKTPLWGEGGAGSSSSAVWQLDGCRFEPHLSKCMHASLCHWCENCKALLVLEGVEKCYSVCLPLP